MKRCVVGLATLFFVVTLSGCSETITEGEVIKKEFTPAHTTCMSMPMYVSTGKTMSVIMIPYIIHYSDAWRVTIQQCVEESGEYAKATYRVEEDVYDEVDIGDWFVWSEDMEPEQPEYTREKQDDAG